MELVTTLRATNCTGLQPLGNALVAACGPKTAYILNTHTSEELGSCVAPREAVTYTLWLPPGAAGSGGDVLVIYGTKAADESGGDSGYEVLVQRQGDGDGSGPTTGASQGAVNSSQSPTGVTVTRLALPDSPAGPLRALSVVHHTVLCVQTAAAVAFYALDPAALTAAAPAEGSGAGAETVAVAKMGECALPLAEAAAVSVLAAPAEPTVVVAALAASGGGNKTSVHVRVVRLSHGVSATVERTTDEKEGITLPKGVSIAAEDILAVRVWWPQQELVLHYKRDGKDGGNAAVLGLPLIGMAGGSAITAWNKRPNCEPEFVTAATRPVLAAASDLCCTATGDVWAVDGSTSSCLLLKNVSSPYLTEIEVPGSSVTAKASVAADAATLFLQAGRNVYAMPIGTDMAATTGIGEASPPAAATSVAASGGRRSAHKQEQRPEEPTTAPPPRQRRSNLSDWLLAQQRQQRQRRGEFASSSSHAAAAADPLAAALLGEGDNKEIREGVVRDVLFVEGASGAAASAAFEHRVLAALQRKGKSRDTLDRAMLRYAAVAQSLHPFTVLLLLSHAANPAVAGGANDGLMLALAAYLSQKPSLQGGGGFHRMASQDTATQHFFTNVAVAAADQKRFTAALCRTAVTALATGNLDAARLLFAVADVAVVAVYGRRQQRETGSSSGGDGNKRVAQEGKEEQEGEDEARQLEATIADAIAVLSSYADWALGSASTALGMMTAHVGEPGNNRKEAALRDGRSHPIRTSRDVEIAPLQLPSRATNSLTTK